ncbi:MAG TPA: DNA-directed RNA polymerase subunit beta', partial [Actinomycetota bacterium]|nr:DNA-directed RNA polymerase subunit beta' [Actinomycetota bacterium]
SGYLTRRLVDVSQDVIIREDDCGTTKGLDLAIATTDATGNLVRDPNVENAVYARSLAADAVNAKGEVVAEAGDDVGDVLIEKLIGAGVETIKVRSVLTCESAVGVCARCYGRSLATGQLVDIGEAVGIIAAQSIGEPGTQLTMRTFHTGGVAGEDITHGLPRVVELFEARKPKGEAQITEISGTVSIEDDEEKHQRHILVTDESGDQVEYPVSYRARLTVSAGDAVVVGQQLTEGSVNPHEKLRVEGVLALQNHLVDEVQQVYRSQGVTIHDKHIELIARQMLRKVHIIEPGDTDFLPGDMVARRAFEEKNAEVVEAGGVPASARPVLLGITKASLATDSWLSAASFQETTRVLTDAAISAKSDPLLGLKENVIIGKLIPAGSGLARYRNVAVQIKPEAIPEYWLARQREIAEAVASETGEPSLVGLTREQAEQMLGGGLTAVKTDEE